MNGITAGVRKMRQAAAAGCARAAWLVLLVPAAQHDCAAAAARATTTPRACPLRHLIIAVTGRRYVNLKAKNVALHINKLY